MSSPSVCRIWSILRQRGQEQVSSFVTKTKKFISKTKGRFTIRRACAFQRPNQSRRYHWARRGEFNLMWDQNSVLVRVSAESIGIGIGAEIFFPETETFFFQILIIFSYFLGNTSFYKLESKPSPSKII